MSNNPMSHSLITDHLRGHLMVFGAGALWGTVGFFGRGLQAGGMEPVEMAFWRAFWAWALLGIGLLVASPRLFRVTRGELATMAVLGLVTVPVFQLIYFTSISMNPIGLAAVLLYTAPLYVTLLAVPLFGERLDLAKAAALLLAMAGCFLVVAPGGSLGSGITLKGAMFGLASGFTYACVSLLGKKFSLRTNPWTMTFYTVGIGMLSLLPLGPVDLARLASYSATTWAYGVGVGLIPTLLSYGLFFSGLRLIDASAASITATVEPVVAAGLGFVLFNETMSSGQLLGAFMVLSAVAWLNLGPRLPVKLTGWSARANKERCEGEEA